MQAEMKARKSKAKRGEIIATGGSDFQELHTSHELPDDPHAQAREVPISSFKHSTKNLLKLGISGENQCSSRCMCVRMACRMHEPLLHRYAG